MKPMRSFIKTAALAFIGAAMSLLVTGCALFDFAGGRDVKFAAASNITTKAVYGADTEDGSYQQIVWEQGDAIRIFSNHAATDGDKNYADYTVNRTGDNGRYSYGKLTGPADGLKWDDTWTSGYEFWSMYPASAATSLTGASFDGTFSASIPSDQYLMVAHANATYGQSKITLEFYPAFTAFRINVKPDVEGVTVNSISLSSTACALTGDFTAQIATNAGSTNVGITNFNVVNNNSLSDTATSSLMEEKDGGVRSFVVFCLPGTLSELVLQCNYTQNGESKSKRLKLIDANGNWLSFDPCKQHRMDLTLKASQGGDIEFNLSIGGAQMILSILKEQSWKTWNMAQEKYYANPPEGFTDFNDFWNKFTNQHINTYFNTYVSGADKVNPPDCRILFQEPYFCQTELEIIRDFLPTVTEYRHQTTLSESIYASDFNYLPNLKYIYQEEIDGGTVHAHNGVSIEIDGMTQLESIDLHKWPNVSVKNCPSLTTLKVTNTTDVPTYVNVENCPALSQFTADGSGPQIHYSFKQMASLQTLQLNDAGSLTVADCPAFTEFRFWNANNLSAITLNNTPLFRSGESYNTAKTVAVSLTDCSTSQAGAVINLRGNGDAANAGKVNSNNVTVNFFGGDGNIKTTF